MKDKIFRIINKKPYIFAFIGFLLIFIIIAIISPNFLTSSNLISITRQVAINAILACGMTFVILTGGIDLSVGSASALNATVIALLLKNNFPVIPTLIFSLILGCVIGAVNGFFVTKTKLPPIIVTLSMMEITRGTALLLTGGYPVSGYKADINFIGSGNVPLYIVIFVFIIAWLFLTYTRSGRYIYAIGGSKEAVKLSGIHANKYELMAYIICGLTTAIAGIILVARTGSGQPNAADGFELNAIASVVLGGTSINGGYGHIYGTLIGAFTLGLINNGLNLLNINPFTQQVVKGIIIIVAILIGLKKKNK